MFHVKQNTKLILGNIVDLFSRRIFYGEIKINGFRIDWIRKKNNKENVPYIVPGFIDSHVHIESSMLSPDGFAYLAVKNGTVATVSDPHEIANVLGLEGVELMIDNGKKSGFKFFFGAPSCVPATNIEQSGAVLNSEKIEKLINREDIYLLSEMMNYPGVISRDEDVCKKLGSALKAGKRIDGHAPGLSGDLLKIYCKAGITTDHECSSLKEAKEKIRNGMMIQIREGSAARNFNELFPLILEFPEKLMFCTDDLHPDDLALGHINKMVKRAVSKGADLFDVLTIASLNPVMHYKLPVGLLREGDPADFIMVDNLDSFNVIATFINGNLVYQKNFNAINRSTVERKNSIFASPVALEELIVPERGKYIRVIEAIDGELITRTLKLKAKTDQGIVVPDLKDDVLKIVLKNRYANEKPVVGFIKGFGLRDAAIASSIAHDSHHVLAVGTHDDLLVMAINKVIETGGGIVVQGRNKELTMPLPVAGLMSDDDPYKVADTYRNLDALAKDLGSPMKAPLMTLSFMALLVIPELKICDKGLFDGNSFAIVPLFI